MQRSMILAIVVAAAAWCANILGFLGPDARASNEHASVTIQDTPQELRQTSKNYKYYNVMKEPTKESEVRYVEAIRDWLASLPDFQREKARKILRDAHPMLHALREGIREKKGELVALSFDRNTPPETLPRLGQELQDLRDQLKVGLKEVEKRLKIEAGVAMGPLAGDGLWLATPTEEPQKQPSQAAPKSGRKAGN